MKFATLPLVDLEVRPLIKCAQPSIDPELLPRMNWGIAQDQLWSSIRSDSFRGVMLAVLNGADVETRDILGYTPLVFAVRYRYYEAAKALIYNGANIDTKVGRDGRKALHWAAIHRSNRCLALLLKAGANIELKTRSGGTPLHFAVCEGHHSTTKLLINLGANVGATDRRLRTPLHCAAEWGQLKTIKLLVEAGADINAKNDKGDTPIESASRCEHTSVVDYLRSLVEK